MDYKDIKKLMDDMGQSKLSEVEIEFPDGTKVSLKKNEETKIEDRSSKQEKSVNENVAKTDMKAKPLKEGTSDSKNENSSLLGIKTLADSKNTKTSHSQQNKESALQGIKTQQTSTADVEGATGAEGASPSAPKEDGKLKGTVKKVGRFVNKKTFQFEKSQGKISKTATVIGKTAVLSGKAIKGISSTSGKISKIEDEGGGGVATLARYLGRGLSNECCGTNHICRILR